MEQQLQHTRDQQGDLLNKFYAGWRKGDELFYEFLKPIGNEIIRLIHSKRNHFVLDVGSGSGEPGLTIASMLDDGKVIIADLAEDRLEIARENAMQRGIKNYETIACDVCDLPFADNTFDAISCRFGFMFFPNMLLAAKEMARVLKPGGKIATSVWNVPEKNFWITTVMDAIKNNMESPPSDAGAPGMFRGAENGIIADLFSQAGLKNILVKEVNGKLACNTAAVYWDVMTQVAAPLVASLAKADFPTKAKIRRRVFQAINQRYRNGNIMIHSSALVISGEK